MDNDIKKVFRHFENMANIFDDIYKGEQASLLYKAVDVLFRKNILERRLKLTLDLAGDVSNKDILDIGCGSGVYSVLLAKGRPNSVVGLDFSSLMIKLARSLAEKHGVNNICKFEECDFMKRELDNKFDIIIAAGIFDYTMDPRPLLSKIKSAFKEKALLTFPVKWTFFTPLRIAWLSKRDCPSYYYSGSGIKKLFEECGLKIESIRKIGTFLVPGNYLVVCKR